MAERLALPTSDHGVASSNPAGGEILPKPKRRFIAQSLSCSPFHRLEMTEILKGHKTLTHPSIFSNCVEVSVQEAVYLALQIPLTKCRRDIVFINTSTFEERIFLLKPKSVLDEQPAESTDVESDNIIQWYSKRPKKLQNFCLADYASKVDVNLS